MSVLRSAPICGLIALLASAATHAQNADLEKKVADLEAQVKALQDALRRAGITTATAGDFPRSERAGDDEQVARTPSLGGIYDKPFLLSAGKKVHIGGYVDMEFIDTEGKNSTFDQHRLIPFIYGDITDNLKFATEIEFEHGGNPDGDGEIKIEFATLDYILTDWLTLRGGIILTPLGKVNLVHDSPLQDLTDRPLVSRNIFPTTLSESGFGFLGEVYPTDSSKLSYEIYLLNGFNGGSSEDATDVAFSTSGGVRSARGSQKTDNNNNKAVAGRVGFSPFLGVDVGGSWHVGKWDNESKETLAIYGVDWTLQKGPFELIGEMGFADIDLSSTLQASNTAGTSDIPEDLFGYYVQGNYHFMPEFLQDSTPSIFREESTFTAVVRYGHIDLDGTTGETDRLTIGLNFRPVERAVFKLDYQFNDGDRASADANELIFSFASYF